MAELNRNHLKLLAAVSMFLDHLGYEVFPDLIWLRILGRLAFPIFAFGIYEGCRYTRNRGRYLGQVLGLGLVCMAVYALYAEEIFGNILITFSLSILQIFLLQYCVQLFLKRKTPQAAAGSILLFLMGFLGLLAICRWLPVDYGIPGVLCPVLAAVFSYIPGKGKDRLPAIGFCLGLILLAVSMGGIQWYSLAAIPILLFFYNGQKGKYPMKYFFYLFYPLHLLAVEGIALLLH